ncbi:hypothetical protein [Proteus vulgaris]|uniref:Uncharacterized protein n=1 Tax=Proteus vulgaris TaxID=585 RepID=A0A6G6SN33_PROVU|nr:hypothetical protein [Proteus vulgaris]QIF94459.1 hypothetical protein GTH24_11355 [Proteus vulgaris]QIF95204.1 hypothetical protein GTH24_15450 [Proteus vulgaris]
MNKSRQQFEEWSDGKDLYDISPFDIWQASRESLEVELPDLGDVILDDYFIDGFNDAISEVEKILISNGVKIKNE